MVTPGQPSVGDWTRNQLGCCLQLVGRAERVAVTGHEQARSRDCREMCGAEAIRAARRVQGVADEDEAGGWEAFAHRHRANPSAHGSPSQSHLLLCQAELPREVNRRGPHRFNQHGGTIGGSAPGESVGKVDAEHGNATSGEGCVEGDQCRLVPSSAGAGSQDDGCRANERATTSHAVSFS